MATAWKIHIDADNTGLWKVKQTEEAAKKASELLQKDLETHHVVFNDSGFHNHIVHHILSLYGTGATPEILQAGWEANTSYQRPTLPANPEVLRALQQGAAWTPYLAKYKYYPDFLSFFQGAIAAKGWEAVLTEHLFAGTPAADDLLVRLFAGFLHPLIQLLFGMEWRQPAIVAEALAQACVHQPMFRETLWSAERNANEAYGEGDGKGNRVRRMPKIVALLEEARGDEKIKTAIKPEDGMLMIDGLFKHAPDELLRLLSKVKVWPEELEEKTAEMFDTSMFMAAAASFHPAKTNKFDFFLIHHINSAPFFQTINEQPWIPVETKARLLEWKIRYDIIQYAGRAVPALPLEKLKAYQPRKAERASIHDALSRVHDFTTYDDGHVIKLSRAALIAQGISKKYEDRDLVLIKSDDMWRRIHHLIADSVEAPGPTWVRTAGLEEAWVDVPERSKS